MECVFEKINRDFSVNTEIFLEEKPRFTEKKIPRFSQKIRVS
jgi:hypothetical protein